MIAPLAIEHEGKADARTVAFLGLEAHPWRISEDAAELEAVRRVETHPTQDVIPLEIVKRLTKTRTPSKRGASIGG